MYQVTFYHDEPEEASADSFTLTKPYPTKVGAIRAARHVLNSQWQTASIHKGTWIPEVFGVRPGYFEDDEQATVIRVGPDWIEP